MNLLKLYTGFLLVAIIPIDGILAGNQSVDTSRCPTKMIRAILESRSEVVQFLLENGENPDMSLDSCHIIISPEGGVILPDDIVFWTALPESILRSFSLLHLAVRMMSATQGRIMSATQGEKDTDPTYEYEYDRQREIFAWLIKYGADTSVRDATGQTPLDIVPLPLDIVAETRVRE